MNELNKVVLPNGTELTVAGGGSDVTADAVRDWGFAFKGEVEDVEAELARFDLFDWNLLANAEFPTGWKEGYFSTSGAGHNTAPEWSRTRRTLYRRNQWCYLQSAHPIRVHAYDKNVYTDWTTAKLQWYIESTDGTPLRFKTDDVLYFYVSVRQPLDTITTDPPKLYWVFPNTPTVTEITADSNDTDIPSAKAVKAYVDRVIGGIENGSY